MCIEHEFMTAIWIRHTDLGMEKKKTLTRPDA